MIELSIIIATYNSAKTIANALESIYVQYYQDWECIIVDGASTDNTIEIVEAYVAKDSRFHYVSETDNGIYDAFNKGWRMAKGEWIYYLGSDDRLTQDGFAKLMKCSKEVDMLGAGVFLVRDGELPKPQYTDGMGGCHQGFVTRRNVLENLNGFDEQYKILADMDFIIRMERANCTVSNYHILLAYFYVGGVSQSIRTLYSVTQERYRIYVKYQTCRYPFFGCVKSYIYAILVFLKHKIFKSAFL